MSKCDRIFDELLKIGYIRTNYVLPSADELKKRAYCKYHNLYSHATNDCNVFRRQVQSALNEGRLSLTDMQLDKNPFPAHMNMVEAKVGIPEAEVGTTEAKAPAILIRPEQAATTQGKNVIIGEPRPVPSVPKNSGRQVLAGVNEEGKTKLTIVASSVQALRRQTWLDDRAARNRPARPASSVGQDDEVQATTKQVEPTSLFRSAGGAQATTKPTRPTSPVGQGNEARVEIKPAEPTKLVGSAGLENSSSLTSGMHVLKSFVPQKPEVGVWKTNEPKLKQVVKPQCTFDRLLAKYKKQKADSENWPTKKKRIHTSKVR